MTARSYRGFSPRQQWTDPQSPGVVAQIDRSRIAELYPRFAPSATPIPYKGITTDGELRRGLFSSSGPGSTTEPMRLAAELLINSMSPAQRAVGLRSVDDSAWRGWFNGFEMPHGAPMRSMSVSQRRIVQDLLSASLSGRGFEQIMNTMQLNEALGDMIGRPDAFGRWHYAITIFGQPRFDEPWGWQLQGHHLALNCFYLGNQTVMTPLFLGAEPAILDDGPCAGLRIMEDEERCGFSLLSSLNTDQKAHAVISTGMTQDELPPGRYMGVDQRMMAGANKDNAIIPYEGIAAADMSIQQCDRLLELVEVYVSCMPEGHGSHKMREFKRHLSEAHFAWIGQATEGNPFYYKVHSPVILIEFDHHSGLIFNNDKPERFHIHSIVRTPNGNDYGRDLLRQHYETHHIQSRHQLSEDNQC